MHVAEAQPASADERRVVGGLAIDEAAVLAAKVAQAPAGVEADEFGVQSRYRCVVDAQLVVGIAAHAHALALARGPDDRGLLGWVCDEARLHGRRS
jgi:hypothetical protein